MVKSRHFEHMIVCPGGRTRYVHVEGVELWETVAAPVAVWELGRLAGDGDTNNLAAELIGAKDSGIKGRPCLSKGKDTVRERIAVAQEIQGATELVLAAQRV
jgi:hypothetical protein